jgi:lipid-binding SYLF domain-containing protein
MSKSKLHAIAFAIVCSLTSMACSTAPKTAEDRADIRQEAQETVATAKQRDSSVAKAIDRSVGYAVFPKVGKGAAGVGGAYGKGVLFEGGKIVGYCSMTQATVGLQLGGQSYSEIICFSDKQALDRFKRGDLAFDAQASTVALEASADANAKFAEGVEVFTMNQQGLMAEASVGGQKFSYKDR